MWCVGASCVVVDAHVHPDRHVDGWFIGVGVRMGRRPRSRSTGGRLRSHPIRSGQIRFDRMCAMWVRSDGRRTPRSQQRVREGGHRVARTTVDDRMNEYVHEWAMQRERECRGSAKRMKDVEPWRMRAWREDVWCGVCLRAQLLRWLIGWSALLLRTES